MRRLRFASVLHAFVGLGLLAFVSAVSTAFAGGDNIQRGTAAFTDYRGEKPGTIRQITVADLPQPFATKSADHGARVVPRPANAWPQTLPGFKVEQYATDLDNPRELRTAPNGDLFVAESDPGRILVLRGVAAGGRASTVSVFASGLVLPFGIAFYPPGPDPKFVYVANTDSVVRFPYHNGDLKASGPAEAVVKQLPGFGRLRGGGHWTRDLAFTADGQKLFISVGSHSNLDDPDSTPAEFHRANILESNADGSDLKIYASGIRNPVGIAIDPSDGQLWTSVNERDALGDNLPPDYISHVQEGGFYGWPWYYTGGHQDPRMQGKHPELRDKVIVPDVLLQPHDASLQLTFYEGKQFPSQYRGDIFAAEHGSWNKAMRTGYEVILVPLQGGRATGAYEDFVTGFVTPDGDVWGRPVGVAVASDGSLMVSDDGSNTVWRVSYAGGK